MKKEELKALRNKFGFSKNELGELLEVTGEYIRRLEKGDLVMGDHLAFKVRSLESELEKPPLHDYKKFLGGSVDNKTIGDK